MKKIIMFLMALLLIGSFASCDLLGFGKSGVRVTVTNSNGPRSLGANERSLTISGGDQTVQLSAEYAAVEQNYSVSEYITPTTFTVPIMRMRLWKNSQNGWSELQVVGPKAENGNSTYAEQLEFFQNYVYSDVLSSNWKSPRVGADAGRFSSLSIDLVLGSQEGTSNGVNYKVRSFANFNGAGSTKYSSSVLTISSPDWTTLPVSYLTVQELIPGAFLGPIPENKNNCLIGSIVSGEIPSVYSEGSSYIKNNFAGVEVRSGYTAVINVNWDLSNIVAHYVRKSTADPSLPSDVYYLRKDFMDRISVTVTDEVYDPNSQ